MFGATDVPDFERVVIGDCCGVAVRFHNVDVVASIYSICPTGTETPIYIGSTTRVIKDRIRAHIIEAKSGSQLPVHEWIRNNQGGFEVRLIEIVPQARQIECERHWVAIHRKTILNLTDGGLGMSGHRFAGTDHARRIGDGLRSGSNFGCQKCGRSFWRKRHEIAKGQNKFCSRSCSNGRAKAVSGA